MAPSLSPLGFTSGHSICYCTFPILAEKSQASALMTEVQGGAVQGSQTPPRLPRPLLHYHLPSALLWRMLVSLLNKDTVQQSSWHLRPQVSAKALQCPWLQGPHRASFWVRHFGTCFCFLCFPVKTRLPPTFISIAVSWEHKLKLGRVSKQGATSMLPGSDPDRGVKTNSVLLRGWLTGMMQAFGLAVPHQGECPSPGYF